MFNINPKLALYALLGILAASVGLGLYQYGVNYLDRQEAKAKELEDARAANKSLMEVNAAINAELIRRVKDEEDRRQIDEDISQETTELTKSVNDLGNKLAIAIAARKEAEAKLRESGVPIPAETEKYKNVPVEISITWEAYCKAARDRDPKCKPKGE